MIFLESPHVDCMQPNALPRKNCLSRHSENTFPLGENISSSMKPFSIWLGANQAQWKHRDKPVQVFSAS